MRMIAERILKPLIDQWIIARLVSFHDALVARGQIALPPAEMSATDLAGCKEADAS